MCLYIEGQYHVVFPSVQLCLGLIHTNISPPIYHLSHQVSPIILQMCILCWRTLNDWQNEEFKLLQ